MMDTMAMLTFHVGAKGLAARTAVAVAEPKSESVRSQRSTREAAAVHAADLFPANTTREPRTLEELGVPGALARELEGAMRLLGWTRGDRVTKATFRSADGGAYTLRTSSSASALPGAEAGDLAA